MSTKKIVFLSIMLGTGIVLNVVESVYLSIFPIPSYKIGLANIITLIILYTYTKKDAFIIIVLRILLASLILGKIFSPIFYISLSGGVLAILIMIMFKYFNIFHIITISILGSLAHSIGQIIAAIFFLNTPDLIYYLPILIIISIFTGIFTGIVSNRVINILKNNFI